MPKHDAFSPKAIANRQKLKGLQRLRWYCQMCQKQCRDENGFKCHTMSEGHLRQMRIFAQNPNQVLDQFSREFEKGFLQILSHSHGTKRVFANRVYQEYISDKNHVHMNGTTWTTLSGFCKYLGKEGKCIVDETEKGWYIQYIDRDPQLLLKQSLRADRKQSELTEEEINKRMIENQIKAAFEKSGNRLEGEEEGNGEDDQDDEEQISDDDEDYDDDDDDAGGEEEHDGDNIVHEDRKNNTVEGAEETDSKRRSVGEGVSKKPKQQSHQPIQIKLNQQSASFQLREQNNSILKKRSVASVFAVEDENDDETTIHASHSGDENKNDKNDKTKSEVKNGHDAMVVGNIMHYGRRMGDSIEKIRQEEERRKKLKADQTNNVHQELEVAAKEEDHRRVESDIEPTWLLKGLIVKIIRKESRYYKYKAIVKDYWRSHKGKSYEAEVQLLDDHRKFEVFFESELETVVPKVGEIGLLLHGKDRSQKVRVLAVHLEDYNCDVEFLANGLERRGIEYDQICKLDTER